MGTRTPAAGQIRLRLDTADGYDASIIVNADEKQKNLYRWLDAQLNLLEIFGPDGPDT